MIHVGIDDTDTLETRGTNQLAKVMARAVADEYACDRIVRHQLLEDPRVPCTSKNGSASLIFRHGGPGVIEPPIAVLINRLRQIMRDDFIPGSDPGLCVATDVGPEIIDFAQRCQQELVNRDQACDIAARNGVYLEGLGGTNDGVIGALAAVGLAAANDGGRVVQWRQWPDDLSGWQPVRVIRARDVEIRLITSRAPVRAGTVDVGKHLRPNWRDGRCVLFVTRDMPSTERGEARWKAVRIR